MRGWTVRWAGLFLARLASPMASFLIVALVARCWGRTLLGQYTTVWVWFAIFQYFALFGIGEFLSKEMAANPAEASRYLSHALGFGLLSSAVGGLMMVGGVFLLQYPAPVRHAVWIAGLALPFSVSALICMAAFTAFQEIRFVVLTSVIQSIVFASLGIEVIVSGRGVPALVGCMVVSWATAALVGLLVAYYRIAPIRTRIEWSFLRRLGGPILAFGVTGLAGQVFMRIDIVILSRLRDMEAVGLYGTASKTLEVLLMVPLTFYGLVLPIAARLWQQSKTGIPSELEGYVRRFSTLLFLEFGLAYLFAEDILRGLYGPEYTAMVGVLRILAVSLLFLSAEMILVLCYQAAGHHKTAMVLALVRSGVNVLLAFILILMWGPLGAAWATLIAIVLSCLVMQSVMCKRIGRLRWGPLVRGPAVACLMAMAVTWCMRDRLSTITLVSVFVLGYVLLLLAFQAFLVGEPIHAGEAAKELRG